VEHELDEEEGMGARETSSIEECVHSSLEALTALCDDRLWIQKLVVM